MIKTIMVQIVVLTVTVLSSSYMATRVALAVTETKVDYIENDIASIKSILNSVNNNQIELAKQNEWTLGMNKRVESIERVQQSIIERSKDVYTRTEAKKDYTHLLEKVNAISKK